MKYINKTDFFGTRRNLELDYQSPESIEVLSNDYNSLIPGKLTLVDQSLKKLQKVEFIKNKVPDLMCL